MCFCMFENWLDWFFVVVNMFASIGFRLYVYMFYDSIFARCPDLMSQSTIDVLFTHVYVHVPMYLRQNPLQTLWLFLLRSCICISLADVCLKQISIATSTMHLPLCTCICVCIRVRTTIANMYLCMYMRTYGNCRIDDGCPFYVYVHTYVRQFQHWRSMSFMYMHLCMCMYVRMYDNHPLQNQW